MRFGSEVVGLRIGKTRAICDLGCMELMVRRIFWGYF